MAAGPEETVHFGPSLTLAEEWMNETGRKTKRALSPPLPDGSKLSLLIVTHGAYQVAVREQGSCIVVSAPVKFPDEVRKKLRDLAPEDKTRVWITLRGELSSNGRAGYVVFPPNLTAIDELEGFSAEEMLKISKDNIGSFNRLSDAVQEVVTIAGRAIMMLGLIAPSQSASTTAVRPASPSLYG